MKGAFVAFLILQTALAGAFTHSRWPPSQQIVVPEANIQIQADESEAAAVPLPKDLWESLAQYAPYFPAAAYAPPPKNCQLVQANILQRHGARGPTASVESGIKQALFKLKSVPKYTDPRLGFLKTFEYDLGSENLTSFGAAESYSAGHLSYQRYASLATTKNRPFIRSSDAERCVLSARSWSNGFVDASDGDITLEYPLTLSEEPGFNNTLENNQCPLALKSDVQASTWLSTYAPPLTARFNSWAPEAALDDNDVFNLQHLCAFEVVKDPELRPTDGRTASPFAPTPLSNPFCTLFNASEWAGYEYWGDLSKYYGTSYGQEIGLGAVQGVGYVNELLARLTGDVKYVVDDWTQVNHTLDDRASSATFPLSRSLYVDFSHDNQMVAIYATMGLFDSPQPLSPTIPDPHRVWITSKLVPFAGRMVVEKMKCTSTASSSAEEEDEFVRILVDDAIMPLRNCRSVSEDGLCPLQAFVESQTYATGQGQQDWLKCFPTP